MDYWSCKYLQKNSVPEMILARYFFNTDTIYSLISPTAT